MLHGGHFTVAEFWRGTAANQPALALLNRLPKPSQFFLTTDQGFELGAYRHFCQPPKDPSATHYERAPP
jgi:hypothetical protein